MPDEPPSVPTPNSFELTAKTNQRAGAGAGALGEAKVARRRNVVFEPDEHARIEGVARLGEGHSLGHVGVPVARCRHDMQGLASARGVHVVHGYRGVARARGAPQRGVETIFEALAKLSAGGGAARRPSQAVAPHAARGHSAFRVSAAGARSGDAIRSATFDPADALVAAPSGAVTRPGSRASRIAHPSSALARRTPRASLADTRPAALAARGSRGGTASRSGARAPATLGARDHEQESAPERPRRTSHRFLTIVRR